MVATGSFIANSFSLQRDLDSVSANETTAAELFIYNPRLFLDLPDSMKETPVTWQEGDTQYVAVTSGWGGAVPLWGGEVAKKVNYLEQGGSVWVFKLHTK